MYKVVISVVLLSSFAGCYTPHDDLFARDANRMVKKGMDLREAVKVP
jgi:hypothetical protein